MEKDPWKIIEELRRKIAELEAENARLRQELYGKKSERIKKKSEEKEESDTKRKAKELIREGRKLMREADRDASKGEKSQASKLRTETVRHRIPEGLFCQSCCGKVRDLGLAHKAEELDVILDPYISREYWLHRGECPCGKVSFIMPPPARGLENTNFSPGFIAKLISDKFRYHFPIHRQEKYLADMGIHIHRQVLNDLVLRSWRQVEPLVKRLWEINRQQPLQQCDESPVCVVKEESQDHYLWCVLTGKAITFKMTERRNQEEASRILGDLAELVLTDGHGCYRGKVIKGKHAQCMAHARRLFFKALLAFPAEAMEVLLIFRDLYRVERLAKTLEVEDRLKLRKQLSIGILNSLITTISGYNPPPRSSLGKAVKYLTKHWRKLTEFTRDGRLPIDNNGVEREFKDAKLGFKNFLFAQSELGAAAVAGFYTLMATCKLHGKSFVDYLSDVLVKLEAGWPQSKIDELLPWNWQPTPRPERVRSITFDGIIEESVSIEELILRRKLQGKVTTSPPMRSAQDPPPA